MPICKTCQQDKPVAEFYSRQRKLPSGTLCTERASHCKPCARIRAKAYVLTRKAAVDQYQKQYREANRKKLNQQAAIYRREHAEEIKQKDRMRQKTPRVRARIRAAYHKRMALLKQNPIAYAKYLARANAANEKWRLSNPEKHRTGAILQSARRRALKKGGATQPIPANILDVLHAQQQGRCGYCQKPLSSERRKTHLDHVVPLTRGGLHVMSNLVLSCQSCNISKSDKLLHVEWEPPIH